MTASLSSQMAVVTGANSGIGEAVAKALGAAGATVVVNYVTRSQAAERVAAEIRSGGGEAIALQADATDEELVCGLFRNAVQKLGTVDILVNKTRNPARRGLPRDEPRPVE